MTRPVRAFGPPADLLLSEADLRAWLEAITPALEVAGFRRLDGGAVDPSAAAVRSLTAREHVVQSARGGWVVRTPAKLPELTLRLAAPSWVRARSLELKLDGAGRAGIRQGSRGYKSARDTNAWLGERFPRWRVPPRGPLPQAIYLREVNGWEGEAWRYYLPISAEATVLALAAGSPVAPGRDVRATPFDPPSLATFGSWAVQVGYCAEWQARLSCETSRIGYQPYHNWSGDCEGELAGLLALARERDLLRWADTDDAGGLRLWKGRLSLAARARAAHKSPRVVLAEVHLS